MVLSRMQLVAFTLFLGGRALVQSEDCSLTLGILDGIVDKSADMTSKPDAYVAYYFGSKRGITPIEHETFSPRWIQHYYLGCPKEQGDGEDTVLVVKLMDHDMTTSDDLMMQCSFPHWAVAIPKKGRTTRLVCVDGAGYFEGDGILDHLLKEDRTKHPHQIINLSLTYTAGNDRNVNEDSKMERQLLRAKPPTAPAKKTVAATEAPSVPYYSSASPTAAPSAAPSITPSSAAPTAAWEPTETPAPRPLLPPHHRPTKPPTPSPTPSTPTPTPARPPRRTEAPALDPSTKPPRPTPAPPTKHTKPPKAPPTPTTPTGGGSKACTRDSCVSCTNDYDDCIRACFSVVSGDPGTCTNGCAVDYESCLGPNCDLC